MEAEVLVHPRPSRNERVEDRYNTNSIVDFIANGRTAAGAHFSKVAVQFPDELLFESIQVMAALNARLREAVVDRTVTLFALADNTFGACCPDEVTAQHYSADAIVHLGYACFSRSNTMPVFNDSPRWRVEVPALATALAAALEHTDEVVVVAHPGAEDVVERIVDAVKPLAGGVPPQAQLGATGSFFEIAMAGGKRVVIAEAVVAPPSEATRANLDGGADAEWIINGAAFPRNTKQRIVFVGPADAPQLHQLVLVAMFNESNGGADAAEGLTVVGTAAEPTPGGVEGGVTASMRTVKQRIRQRTFNIEHIKAASVVGIVVASLGIRNFKETAEQMRNLLIRNGKRAYIVFVGHLNQYKLANFVDSVDCFCVIACPNSRAAHFTAKADGIMKPLVAPVEVAIALGYEDFMSPRAFTTQFDRVLTLALDRARPRRETDSGDDGASGSDADDRGQLISTRPLNVAVTGTSALQRFSERSYQGLDPQVGQTAVQQELVQGRAGIARGYVAERDAQDQPRHQPAE